MRIYIAGPYTQGDLMTNLRKAICAAEEVAARGHFPFVPHLTAFWHFLFPHRDTQFWYDQDNAWLEVCDAVLRLPGPSHGADKEVELASALNKLVYYDISEIPKGE